MDLEQHIHKSTRWRTFHEARNFAHSLHLASSSAWKTWVKTAQKPQDIPADPRKVYREQWVSWGDWLGTETIAPQKRVYKSFEEARTFVRTLNLNSYSEWRKYCKSGERPLYIPGDPVKVYKNKGWVSWGDWLGTEIVSTAKRDFLPFEEARSFVRSLNLKSAAEWKAWYKSDARPLSIPSNPSRVYQNTGWISLSDWLGTNTVATFNRSYRSFEESRKFARSLGLASSNEWKEWTKSGKRPEDIPVHPNRAYKDQGWIDWGDWLGTGSIATFNRKYRSFKEARSYVHSLSLANKEDWQNWSKSTEKPDDIPATPDRIYHNKGWQGWGDWLGSINSWTLLAIRNFIHSLLEYLHILTSTELYLIFQQNGLLNTYGNSRNFIKALSTGRFPKEELEKFAAGKPSLVDEFVEDSERTLEDLESSAYGQTDEKLKPDDLDADQAVSAEDEDSGDLPTVETKDVLNSLGHPVISSADEEAIAFLLASARAKIWKHTFRDEQGAVEQANRFRGEGYGDRVRAEFLDEYHRAKSLEIPAGYAFRKDGKLASPNLMQRLIAVQVRDQKRVGNWSGTGAGKTLSAVLASRVVGANLTLVCCPNSVVNGWKDAIFEIFPYSQVATKTFTPNWNQSAKPRYLVLNYEMFQQDDSALKLRSLLEREIIDLIVIDEIHYTKQRHAENMSRRKELVSALVSAAEARNPDVRVLGMSATPVINNLQEGKSLVELVTGIEHDDLATRPTVPNCMKLHQKLVTLGIRWMPDYKAQLGEPLECPIEIDCGDFLPDIRALGDEGSPLALEQILTQARLSVIREQIQPKTLIYTYYVQEIDQILIDALTQDGWKVECYTGNDKSGLQQFLQGNLDVLIGSSAISTGVDKLQYVCNRLILNVLPWTHAEYEQLLGRIYRQGQQNPVTVIFPLTYAMVNGDRWSWCDSKRQRLKFKKSIADAAVDGVVPEGHLRSPSQAYQDVMAWLQRLETGDIQTIQRRKLFIPLPPPDDSEVFQNRLRRYGEFSQINQRWNTSKSQTTHQKLQDNPEEWQHYHALYREARKTWAIVPYEEMIRWCEKRLGLVIGDFGCGEAKLAEALSDRHTIHSFDHIAINENVIPCDIAHVPLDDESLDVAVFSLSLMGVNFMDYLQEAHRTLKLDGHLHIIESTSRFKDLEQFKIDLYALGFDILTLENKDKFTHIRAMKSERSSQTNVRLNF